MEHKQRAATYLLLAAFESLKDARPPLYSLLTGHIVSLPLVGVGLVKKLVAVVTHHRREALNNNSSSSSTRSRTKTSFTFCNRLNFSSCAGFPARCYKRNTKHPICLLLEAKRTVWMPLCSFLLVGFPNLLLGGRWMNSDKFIVLSVDIARSHPGNRRVGSRGAVVQLARDFCAELRELALRHGSSRFVIVTPLRVCRRLISNGVAPRAADTIC